MLEALFVLLIVNPAQAKSAADKVVYASCECEVYDDAGHLIQPHAYTGSHLPIVRKNFEVNGKGLLISDDEQSNCQEIESGQLTMSCTAGALRAQSNAQNLCREIAQKYHPEKNRGFLYSNVDSTTCVLSVDDDELEEESPTWGELIKNINPF